MSQQVYGVMPKDHHLRGIDLTNVLPSAGRKGERTMKRLRFACKKILRWLFRAEEIYRARSQNRWEQIDYEKARHRLTTYGGQY
ncbi:MAG: hypothetical protein KDD61_05820 [Bdellovibrionales bacterium]|nr:hypothetical protein [Bdellovibrionales bacterium]